ncbi:hypothetical protein K438DRAFT_1977150 [Mycena galopus ATCC 62051]|nr:hypothetical protein K438DRAFT_1977150 [Mycena galopus ATCC 62051]
MAPTITPSLHALRHPNRPVQLSRNRRVGVSAAGKAESSLKRVYAKQRRIKFNERVDQFFAERDVLIAALAKEYGKKERNVRALLCNQTQYKAARRPSLRNAVVHQRWLDLQEDGIVKGLQEIRAELKEEIEEGTFSLDDIEKDEATALINQLLEHRQLKRRGVRVTTKAAQLDGFQTARRIGNALLDLYERTGIRGLAIFSRGCADNPGIPHAVDSDDSMEFLQQELDLPPLDFLRKFEHWCVMQDEEEPDDNGVNGSRKEVSRLVLEGLRQITKISTITMEWVNYEVAIREARGIELAGLPPDIPLLRPGTWNIETARRFCDGLRDGSIHWVTMTKAQHDELKAELNQRRAEMGAGALIKKAERSDKGKAHAKKNNAGKRAEVQATGEGPSAVLAAARAATGAGTLLAAGTVRAEGTVFDTVGSALPAGNTTTDVVYPQLINIPRDSEGLPTMLGDLPLLTMAELDEIELGMDTWFGPQPATPDMPSLLQTLGVTVATPAPPALPRISMPDTLVTMYPPTPAPTLPTTILTHKITSEPLLRAAETSTASAPPLRFISFSAAGNETTGSRKRRKRAPNGGAATGARHQIAMARMVLDGVISQISARRTEILMAHGTSGTIYK